MTKPITRGGGGVPIRMMKLSDTLNEVLRQCRLDGVTMLPPKPESEVLAVLEATGRKVSRDVVELYCATDGMVNEMDGHCWSLWPLEKLVAENATHSRPYILFSDFLMHSYAYCFNWLSEDESAVCIELWDGNEPRQVAGSLNQFFEMYLTQPATLELF